MIQKDKIKDWTGRIIGIIETDTVSGNKVVKDWHGKILGRYIKRLNHSLENFSTKNLNVVSGTNFDIASKSLFSKSFLTRLAEITLSSCSSLGISTKSISYPLFCK